MRGFLGVLLDNMGYGFHEIGQHWQNPDRFV